MKILITGAAGQIGSGLSKLLIENGHDLTLVDNLRNGYLENLKDDANEVIAPFYDCLLYTSPSPRDFVRSRMPSSA